MRRIFSITATIMAFMVLILMTACAQKAIVKQTVPEPAAAVEPQTPAQTGQDEAAEKARKEAEERARQEALAQQQAEREKAMAEAEAKVEQEASAFRDIHFNFDRYNLAPEDRQILDDHAKWLMAHPEYIVQIEGNCDERGTAEYNLALGDRRAMSARDYLADLGIPKERMSTISYGKERPLDPAHSEEAWAKNRRDHFTVTKKK